MGSNCPVFPAKHDTPDPIEFSDAWRPTVWETPCTSRAGSVPPCACAGLDGVPESKELVIQHLLHCITGIGGILCMAAKCAYSACQVGQTVSHRLQRSWEPAAGGQLLGLSPWPPNRIPMHYCASRIEPTWPLRKQSLLLRCWPSPCLVRFRRLAADPRRG
jgi:hypothetical protein